MKHDKNRGSGSITKPLLRDLLTQQKLQADRASEKVTVGETPLAPPDLYQDAGGGYNADFTFPQE